MDEYNKNRFGYINELNDNELLAMRDNLKSEIESLNEILNDPEASTEQRSEIENRDIPFEKERLSYTEELIKARGLEAKPNILK